MMEQENQDNNNAQGVSFIESIMHLLVMPGNNDPQPMLFTCLFDCLNIYIDFFVFNIFIKHSCLSKPESHAIISCLIYE